MKLAYKNVGHTSKTFHGVTFNPGETKLVDSYINNPTMIRANVEAVNSTKKVSAVKSQKLAPKSVESEAPQETPNIELDNKEEESDGTD